MIEPITGLPDNVVAITASGQVNADDYENIIIPLVEEKAAQYEKIRLLYHLGPDFRKFTTTALWDDAKIGLHHLKNFERVAVVTDIGWIQTMIGAIGKAVAIEVRAFGNDEFDAAKFWIGE